MTEPSHAEIMKILYKLLINYAHFTLLGGFKRPISPYGNVPAQKLMYVHVPIRCQPFHGGNCISVVSIN